MSPVRAEPGGPQSAAAASQPAAAASQAGEATSWSDAAAAAAHDPAERARLLRRLNVPMSLKLAGLATAMFGFGWAMVPIYNAICEATGIRVLTQRDDGAVAEARNTQIDASRTITVEFDSNSHGPWRFQPEARSIDVHPGELVTVMYDLTNTSARDVSGQAIPSYAPKIAAASFTKVECFCFQQQRLQAHESRRFPVVFFIDPKLPDEIRTITLSYTFFDVGGTRQSVAAPAAVPAAGDGRG